jgi:hypothetical protein
MRVQGGANMNNSESTEEAYEGWFEHLALTQLRGAYVVRALNRRTVPFLVGRGGITAS